MKYRKKPIEVEAYQWFKVSEYVETEIRDVDYYRSPKSDGHELCGYCGNVLHNHGWVNTAEGGHIVCPGDWIITGIKGEKYPCKHDIFEKTYEKV